MRSCKTRFAAIARAAWLSQFNTVAGRFDSPRSLSREVKQVTSHAVNAIVRYSTSADDLTTTVCFYSFHEMGEEPKSMQYPVVERRVVGQLAQSLSQKAVSFAAECDASKMP